MSNEDNKVSISAEQFGSPDGERLPATDSMFTSSQPEDQVTKKILISLDPKDPDTDATRAFIEQQLKEGLRINYVEEEFRDVPTSMKVVTDALRNDPSYAWGWHCNIAMAARDEGVDVITAQRLAARFLRILTTGVGETPVDTSTFQEYKDLEAQYTTAAKE